jgi:acyl carrier protein
MDLFEEIKQVVSEQLGVKPEEIKPTASFRDDLGADSLDAVELIMALEEKFGIEIPDKDAEEMLTVNDAIKYIENKINKPQNIEENIGGN